MDSVFSPPYTLGILGGGQLGKMLLANTLRMTIQTRVLDPDATCPSRLACNHFQNGSFKDYDTVLAFGRQCDVLTIEIENVNVDALEQLEKEGIAVFPQSEVIRLIQDKSKQKEFYRQQSIPTAFHARCRDLEELRSLIQAQEVRFPFVWKSTRDGYDGKGVAIISLMEELDTLTNGPCIAEDLINIEKEIAVLVARNRQGEKALYPPVEMSFHPTANQVTHVGIPARLTPPLYEQCVELAAYLADKLGIVGLLAVEMFVTREGQVLVNEMAPRPHNSGHLTIESSRTSQFEQHLRAILNLPLGSTETTSPAVMVNLVGAEGYEGKAYYEGATRVMNIPGAYLHFYGKEQTKPWRKMGHVTICDASLDQAWEKASYIHRLLSVKTND